MTSASRTWTCRYRILRGTTIEKTQRPLLSCQQIKFIGLSVTIFIFENYIYCRHCVKGYGMEKIGVRFGLALNFVWVSVSLVRRRYSSKHNQNSGFCYQHLRSKQYSRFSTLSFSSSSFWCDGRLILRVHQRDRCR